MEVNMTSQEKASRETAIALAIQAGVKTYVQIAAEFHTGPAQVVNVAKKHGLTRRRGLGSPAYTSRKAIA